MGNELNPQNTYHEFLQDIKNRVQLARTRAILSVNRELIILYWHIGREILERQNQQGWGSKIVDRLARDLKAAFPEMRGFSRRNLSYMRTFAERFENPFAQQVAAQLPWFHICTLLDKVKDPEKQKWYACAAVENGWSRAVLEHQIEGQLFERQGKTLNNFKRTLPPVQSDLAQQIFRDPMNLGFLALSEQVSERNLERRLMERLKDFMLELGVGFAFVGNQYPLEVDGRDFYLDLLFYHLKLRCFVVIDLKVTDFQPEFVGKMGFYLAAVDHLLKHEADQPSIGLILCKGKSKTVAEWSLRDASKSMAVAEYRTLPSELLSSLPTPEQLEAELDG